MYYIEGRGAFSPLPHSGKLDRMRLDAYYPAHRYLTISAPLTSCTEILRFAQDDWGRRGRLGYSGSFEMTGTRGVCPANGQGHHFIKAFFMRREDYKGGCNGYKT